MPLLAQFAPGLDPRGPTHHETAARSAKMTGDLFRPLEGCVERPGPADREMIFVLRLPDFIDRLQHCRDVVGKAVLGRHVVESAVQAALRTATVIAERQYD